PCFVALTRRTPPTSTPVPYTTLFRSSGRIAVAACTVGAPPLPGVTARARLANPRVAVARSDQRALLVAPTQHTIGPVASQQLGRDRKSTRLNSSHEWISYAVFCLKNK